MSKTTSLILAGATIGICAAAVMLFKPPVELTEAQRVAAANRTNDAEIFERCSDVRPLTQFIEIFKPSEALEFFDNATMKEVVSVAAVVNVDGGYKASFVAPVTISESGKYRLTGPPMFFIEDLKGGVFTKNLPSGTSSGPSIRLGPILWNRFVGADAKIDSLREVKIHSDEA